MQPHEKIRHLFFNLLRKLFIFIGHDFYGGGEFKPYWLSYIMYGYLASFYIGAIYTVIYYDMLEKLNTIALTGIAVQVKIKRN